MAEIYPCIMYEVVHVSIRTEIAVVTSFRDAVEKLSFHDSLFCTIVSSNQQHAIRDYGGTAARYLKMIQ